MAYHRMFLFRLNMIHISVILVEILYSNDNLIKHT